MNPFKLAGISAIIYTILIIPTLVMGIKGRAFISILTEKYLYIIFSILGFILIAAIFLGFYKLGKNNDCKFLSAMSIIFLVFAFLIALSTILFLLINNQINSFVSMAFLIISGIISAIFGISLLRLKEISSVVTALGCLYMIMGGLSILVILSFITPIIDIIISILEAVLFFKLSKLYYL